MPKEKIGGANIVVVSWSRESEHVQVCTENPDRLVTETGERPKDYPHDALPPTKEGLPFGGWYVDLDRHQINDLIRVLRRARDHAYGADA